MLNQAVFKTNFNFIFVSKSEKTNLSFNFFVIFTTPFFLERV